MYFRNDDVFYKTNNERFMQVDALFKQYQVPHIIAVLAAYIDTNPELTTYIKATPHIDVQLHGWKHIDYTQEHAHTIPALQLAITTVEQTFGKRPTIWFPPWNKADDYTIAAAASLGLTTSYQKNSLSQFIRNPQAYKHAYINFHSWADADAALVETALQVSKTIT